MKLLLDFPQHSLKGINGGGETIFQNLSEANRIKGVMLRHIVRSCEFVYLYCHKTVRSSLGFFFVYLSPREIILYQNIHKQPLSFRIQALHEIILDLNNMICKL